MVQLKTCLSTTELFRATNADAIFKYAYEQGMADAIEGIVKETKNVDMDVRTNTITDQSGTKFRVVENNINSHSRLKRDNKPIKDYTMSVTMTGVGGALTPAPSKATPTNY